MNPLLLIRNSVRLEGAGPFGFHVVNVGLQLVVSCLFARFCHQLFSPLSTSLTFLASILFATHPIHVEAVRDGSCSLYSSLRLLDDILLHVLQVANVVGRAELLAAIFFLLAFTSFTKAVSSVVRLFFFDG